MKITHTLLLAGIIGLGSTGLSSAQEKTKSIEATQTETTATYEPVIVSKGSITLKTTHFDGTTSTETIDLTGMDVNEIKSLLGRKQGEVHSRNSEYYKARGKSKREYNRSKGEYYRNKYKEERR